MGDVIRKRLFRYNMAIAMTGIVLFFYMTGILLFCANYQVDERYIRVEVNRFVSQLNQKGIHNAVEELPEISFPYTLFDKDGIVIRDTDGTYEIGEWVDLAVLGSCTKYFVPVLHQGELQGLLMVDATEYRYEEMRAIMRRFLVAPVGVAVLLCYLVLQKRKILTQDIWNPIEKIHQGTKRILEGNYEDKIGYDYVGEIGALCHDFEKMRDNIRDSYLRERQMMDKERVLYASISHDLRTPLAIVKGYLEGILYGVMDSPEEINSALQHSITKINGINKMAGDILVHSQAQLGQLSIELQEVYADEYFAEILGEYQKEAKQQKYEFTYSLPPKVLLRLDVDRMAQVMQNLISNAVKYANTNLKLAVNFELLSEDERSIIVSVKDNGCGIEAVDLPFVFDLFYRGNKARTQDIPGSGLGLHIVKYIVEQHGGRIECDSIVGVGTTISFSIPVM